MVAGWEVSFDESKRGMDRKQARSCANRSLPPIPPEVVRATKANPKWPPTTLMLFYQYIEPAWTPKQHRGALSFVMQLGKSIGVTGRGRCSAEGLNCTMTGTAEGVRAFAQGLRNWDSTFDDCDFKFTDGLDHQKKFKSLTIAKKEELVAYGLPVEMAPSLKANKTVHLEADDYHKMMTEPNTVIIDIRNHYEAVLGHFQPPPGGAEFINPRVRNSHELPKWLGSEETQEKLKGKKVMMYCTGGIRCERFSALMSQLKEEHPEFKTNGEFMVRGGVERYIRTFPEGGYWKGKNFLFDKRQEQVGVQKPQEELDKEIESVCCMCKKLCGVYRGGFKCSVKGCQVPVIVCADCRESAEAQQPPTFKCPLCEEGFELRTLNRPSLRMAQKRKAGDAAGEDPGSKAAKKKQKLDKEPSTRLFVGNLPLVIDAQTIRKALGKGVKLIHWIPDRQTGLWYGSIFVEMETLEDATRVVGFAAKKNGMVIGKRSLRIGYSPPGEDIVWPPQKHEERERPPVPVDPPAPAARRSGKNDAAEG